MLEDSSSFSLNLIQEFEGIVGSLAKLRAHGEIRFKLHNDSNSEKMSEKGNNPQRIRSFELLSSKKKKKAKEIASSSVDSKKNIDAQILTI